MYMDTDVSKKEQNRIYRFDNKKQCRSNLDLHCFFNRNHDDGARSACDGYGGDGDYGDDGEKLLWLYANYIRSRQAHSGFPLSR